jgi:hypothetical protein
MMHERVITPAKPTRNELLAEYYMRAAGVAAIWIDLDGHVGAQDVPRLFYAPGKIVFCCLRGTHWTLAYRLYEWKCGVAADQFAMAEKLHMLAAGGGVALTPLDVALSRALDAVRKVNSTIDAMANCGQLAEFNKAFKAARKVDPSVRYHDFLFARKAAMLEALAREGS